MSFPVSRPIATRGNGGTFFIFVGTAGDPDAKIDQIQVTAAPSLNAVPPFGPQYNLNAKLRSTATDFA